MLDANRLSTPSWSCIHFTGADAIRPDLSSALETADIALFNLRGDELRSSLDVFRALAEAMAFPNYYGMNWDATEECLRDLGDWRPANGYVLFVHDAEWLWRQAYEPMGKLAEVWLVVAQEWARDDTAFHLVFVGSTPALSAA
ncbi:MAG: barstar family protein [Dongiaceae bacterium]